MNGTTNVDLEFRLLQFLEKEKRLTVEEKQSKDVAIKIREYLEKNVELELPVNSNKKLVKAQDVKLKNADVKKDVGR